MAQRGQWPSQAAAMHTGHLVSCLPLPLPHPPSNYLLTLCCESLSFPVTHTLHLPQLAQYTEVGSSLLPPQLRVRSHAAQERPPGGGIASPWLGLQLAA